MYRKAGAAMCGRYTLMYDPEELQAEYDLVEVPEGYLPRYNIAPTQPVLTLTAEKPRQAQYMRWGLVPFWARDVSIGSKLINARGETLAEKPAFRSAFARRRCLILADGFYEWQRAEGKSGSIPWFFHEKDSRAFGLAGLWESWRGQAGEPLLSCTIVTTFANGVVGKIHQRMPVMLTGGEIEAWLSDSSASALAQLLRPYPDERLDAWQVSKAVNAPLVDFADLVKPVC